jgi:CBS domain-containing protein
MKSSKHGSAIIRTPDAPQGTVTERDIVCKVVSENRDPRNVKMREIITKDLLSIDASAPLSALSQIMTERGARRLLVRDGTKVMGFITSRRMLAGMNDCEVSAWISRLQTPWL